MRRILVDLLLFTKTNQLRWNNSLKTSHRRTRSVTSPLEFPTSMLQLTWALGTSNSTSKANSTNPIVQSVSRLSTMVFKPMATSQLPTQNKTPLSAHAMVGTQMVTAPTATVAASCTFTVLSQRSPTTRSLALTTSPTLLFTHAVFLRATYIF